MEPYIEKRQPMSQPGKYPLRFVVDQVGGQVMAVVLLALMMSFVVALVKPDALLGFAACLAPIIGGLAYRAVGEDRHIKAKLLEGQGGAGHA